MNIIIPNLDSKDFVNKTDFEGSSYFNVIVMYFLSHKHDNSCVILNETYNTDKTKNIHWKEEGGSHKHDTACVLLPSRLKSIPSAQTDVSLRYIEPKKGEGYISVPKPEKEFWKKFGKCSSKRFVVLPFGYNCLDSGHANYLLYDKKTRSLERFESYGEIEDDDECLNPPNLDMKIKKLFQDNLGKSFVKEYHKPLSFCPSKNFQTIQENEKEMRHDDPVGFCSVWSAWYIDLRLSNPNVDRKRVVKIALEQLKKLKKEKGISFTTFIRNYSNLIVNVSKEIKAMY